MVHVRSTHVDDPVSGRAQHLVSVKDVSTLEETANMLAERYSDHADALLKGKEMVEILAPLNLDTESLLAALYAPLVDKVTLDVEELPIERSLKVLLRNVQQMQNISELQSFQHGQPDGAQIDNVRRMLLSMVEDVRAVLIKLAERICFLREVKNADEETRVLAVRSGRNIRAISQSFGYWTAQMGIGRYRLSLPASQNLQKHRTAAR